MSPQQFSLRWNNHTKNLVQVFAEKFELEQQVDVTISCQGRFIKAHKIVLGACSPYFQELFDTHESTPHPIIIMNGYNYDDVRSIVEFMYRGEVMVAETAMQRLLAAAEDLQIKGLSNVRSKRDTQQNQQQCSEPEDNNEGASSVCSGPSSTGGRSAASSPNQANNSRRSAAASAQQFNNSGDNNNNANNNNNDATQFRTRSNSNNFSSPDAPLNNASGNKQGAAFLRRRKRARTLSYDSEMKRKLRVHSSAKFPQQDEQGSNADGANGEHKSNDGDADKDDLMMTINIEPPILQDVDGISKDEAEEASLPVEAAIKMPDMEPKEKIPRPPNSFMIFANEWRRQLASQFPNESNKEISVRLGVMWKNLTDEVKAKYFNAARRANDDHKKKYPDYHYNPKEARMRKMWKLQQQSQSMGHHLVTTASHH